MTHSTCLLLFRVFANGCVPDLKKPKKPPRRFPGKYLLRCWTGVFGRFFGGSNAEPQVFEGVWRSKGYNKHSKLQK